ncbi:hypothetical protein DIPPA_05317 [Diplonema papillatum]|nr:hypothetical protein DIPPA_05317 [Diplonema papillatum]
MVGGSREARELKRLTKDKSQILARIAAKQREAQFYTEGVAARNAEELVSWKAAVRTRQLEQEAEARCFQYQNAGTLYALETAEENVRIDHLLEEMLEIAVTGHELRLGILSKLPALVSGQTHAKAFAPGKCVQSSRKSERNPAIAHQEHRLLFDLQHIESRLRDKIADKERALFAAVESTAAELSACIAEAARAASQCDASKRSVFDALLVRHTDAVDLQRAEEALSRVSQRLEARSRAT